MVMPSVIIVGAGVAGVAAASRLLACGIRDVTILEAETRIGGRIFTTNLDKSVIELGAQWIHGEELNVAYGLGKPLGLIENSLNDFSKVTCVLSDGNFVDGKVSSLLYQVCQDILHEDTIQKFDGSVGEYFSKRFREKIVTDIDDEITDSYLEWFHSFKNSIDGSDSWFEISSNNNDYVECNGNLLLRWKHGYKTIFDLLMQKYSDGSSQELPVLNKTLLNKEVSNIIWKNVKPKVICNDGTSYSADHVIITVSLGVLKECVKTMFDPPLPEYKFRAIDGLEIGTVNKIFLKFPYKWWPDDCHGFSFLWKKKDRLDNCIVEDNFTWSRGIFGFYTDDSGPTILLGWVVGPSARQMETFSDKEVENACVTVLNKFLGRMYNIPQPVCSVRSKWHSNPHFRGSYSYHSIRTENSNATSQHLAEPLVVENKPVVMFAGEASHNHYFSTVHGALETGWKEANRIISLYKSEDNCTEKNEQFYDVVIIGAGMAGLAAARTLLLNGIENIVILEAQNHAGGRVHSLQLEEGTFIELGAQWIHGQGNEIYTLAHKNGLLSEIVSSEGEGAYLQYNGSEIPLSLMQEVSGVVGKVLEECEQFCDSDSEPPLSVGDYLRERFIEYLNVCQDPPDVKQCKENLFDWHVRFQVIDNSCDNLETLSAKLWGCYQFTGGQDYINFKHGYSSLVHCFLEELPGYVLKLNAPVKQVNWMKCNFYNGENFHSVYCDELCKMKTGTYEEFPVQVVCDSGEKYNAKHVIVTSSLGYLKRNHCTLFKPLLPRHLQQIINNMGFDTINKIFLIYKNQWWTENDKGFQIIWSQESITLLDKDESWMRDLSGFDVLKNFKGVLVGWCGGKGAVMVEKIPEKKIGEHCTHLLRNITRNKNIPLPDTVVRSCWNSNQYICGGYSHTTNLCDKSKFDPSILSSPVYVRTLTKKQHPAILLAGEAAHKKHFSTTHGAYESGESQAHFIVNYIKSNS